MATHTSNPRDGRLPWPMVVVSAALAVLAAVVGLLSWPPPVRTLSGWQIAEVPGSLWLLLVVTTVACLAVAAVMTVRATGVGATDPLAWAWGALVLLAAATLVWNALYSAALSATESGPIIPIFHWLFTFAPALVAGWFFSHRGRGARWAAALGTGVVTVPLLAVSWALLDSSGLSLTGVLRALYNTAVFGIVPLAGAVALVGARDGRRPSGQPGV
jgi:hypothetical protein